ncbi:MAG TPA: rRNA maturation RNase YbeY [Chitinophagaceae bacterium]|nr:rRNA maturation RNase YbeY [Chitinophagaceae bacterium]MCC6636086.1 rRNA maturation RNase YbeY [Chitinophagaceae bacterium]HMZ45227.1 rRNA maturation RNase YbeY [Chitinophagaceae bacterium]HNE92698.1 rRNA maturation RNase YbeY [Chitinophagaceae bacterium]HNM33512.1 rRNA maturation RNase YbeY [Chitinophagaceae bacterium]
MKSKVYFNNADRNLVYKNKTNLKQFVATIFELEKIELETINYIFCSDEYLLKINQQFLNHHYYTDIITFCLSSPKQPIISEAYISIDRVKENAYEFNTSFNNEIRRVVFHGALHLCGYKDKSKKSIDLMREKETFYLNMFNSQM